MIALAAMALTPATIQTGHWRITTTIAVAAIPSLSMPPDPMVRVVETKSSKLMDFVRIEFLRPECRLTRYDDSGFALDAKQICDSREFGRTVWTLQGSYSPFRIDARVTARGKRDRQPVVVTKTIVAELLASGAAYPDRSVSRRELEIKGGQWTRVGADEQIRLDVTSDDRCPEGLLCEWAGMVRARLSYRGARGFSREDAIGFPSHHDAGTPDVICAWSRRIQIVEVLPKSQKGVAINLQDYRFRAELGQCGDESNSVEVEAKTHIDADRGE